MTTSAQATRNAPILDFYAANHFQRSRERSRTPLTASDPAGGATQSFVPAPVLSPFADQAHWVLLRPLEYRIGDTGLVMRIPQGFVTDFASIPRALWQLYPPHGRYSRAALIHDYLYWKQHCTREQADQIMLTAMEDSQVKPGACRIIYRGVRLGGQAAWKANARERLAGKLRVIPEEYLPIPDAMTWEEYQRQLIAAGVREPASNTGRTLSLRAR